MDLQIKRGCSGDDDDHHHRQESREVEEQPHIAYDLEDNIRTDHYWPNTDPSPKMPP